ncbi:MAG: glutathione S-transferase family protein [Myxococcota bacterium]
MTATTSSSSASALDSENADSNPKIRLFTQATNPFTEKVAAALALKRLSFERVVSDDPEDVARWSPVARTLPVLEIAGRRKADSIKIVSWLDTLYPEPPLISPDPRTAEAQMHLAEWSDDSFVWYFNRWRAARYPQPGDEEPIEESLLGRIRDHVARHISRVGRTGAGVGLPTSRADGRELEIIGEIEDRMDDLVGFLRDRPFFHADEPSVADLSVYAMLVVLQAGAIPNCDALIAERPTLVDFVERMGARIELGAASPAA